MKNTICKLTRSASLTLCFWLLCGVVSAQQVFPLQEEGGPALTAYLPATGKATGTAILVIPGGAYTFLATDTEGAPVAKTFAEAGIAAFVLKYRLPGEVTSGDKSMAPLQDAQKAMKMIKEKAKEWGIDANRVGAIGYSAGGHLAATLGTHFSDSSIPNPNNISLRPAFIILVYPVISMQDRLTHAGSRASLLGAQPTAEKLHFFSSEENVSWQTPPTFLMHANDDGLVSFENSKVFYNALVKEGVKAELHLYPKGDHGFTQRWAAKEWLEPMLGFIKRCGF